jgi:hypothetical protein
MRTLMFLLVMGIVGCDGGAPTGPVEASLTKEQRAAWERARAKGHPKSVYLFVLRGTKDPKWGSLDLSKHPLDRSTFDFNSIGTDLVDSDKNSAFGINGIAKSVAGQSASVAAASVNLFGGESPEIVAWYNSSGKCDPPDSSTVRSLRRHLAEVQASIGNR